MPLDLVRHSWLRLCSGAGMWILLLSSLAGLVFCAAFHQWIDDKALRLWHAGRTHLQSRLRRDSTSPYLIQTITHLAASLRAGISLDGAIESAARDTSLPKEARLFLGKILQGGCGDNFLSSFLSDSLRTGAPVLSTLLLFQKSLQTERRVKLKAQSLTSQSRAQAEVLSWLPVLLLLALAVVDNEWFLLAGKSAASWLLWGISLLLLGLGRQWMKFVLARALRPSNSGEDLQEIVLPELILRMISQISLGRDTETALEKTLASMNHPGLARAFAAENPPESVAGLRGLFLHGARTGAPLRDDLSAYLADLHLLVESRWEERVQRLPVSMMAPLFLCFFPSSLLVLVALLLPLLPEGF